MKLGPFEIRRSSPTMRERKQVAVREFGQYGGIEYMGDLVLKLEALLSRLSPLPPEASRPAPPAPPPDPGPSRDRFELIELD